MESVATKSGRATRWHMELAAYNFKTEYIPGHCNDVVSDALSRLISVPEGDPSIRPVSDTTWRAPMEAEAFAMDLERLLTVPEFRADYCGAGASAKFGGEGYDLNSNYDTGVFDRSREWAAASALRPTQLRAT